MQTLKAKNGFTLLEVIIVIIIVGVLASLALPRFFSTVEYSKAAEAMESLSTIRQSIERCYLMRSAYTTCNAFANLDVTDPGTSPNHHFTYAITSGAGVGYTITATRNTIDGGDGASLIRLTNSGATVTKNGTGPFGAVQ